MEQTQFKNNQLNNVTEVKLQIAEETVFENKNNTNYPYVNIHMDHQNANSQENNHLTNLQNINPIDEHVKIKIITDKKTESIPSNYNSQHSENISADSNVL